MILALPDAQATRALGARIARALAANVDAPALVALSGELGAGKTTLVAGLLRELGHEGPTKSPTYTLVEPYVFGTREFLHCDLYRLESPEALDDLGLRDALTDANVVLVEWPDRAGGRLGTPDLVVHLAYLNGGREARVEANNENGARLLAEIRGVV